jgi:hypothetical protein
VDINQPGEWQLKFVGKRQEAPLEVTTAFVALGDQPALATETPADPAAMATVFADSVAAARQMTSPLSLPGQPGSPLALANNNRALPAVVSPLPVEQGSPASITSPLLVSSSNAALSRGRSPFGAWWWLWAFVALLPVFAIFRWALRPYQENDI